MYNKLISFLILIGLPTTLCCKQFNKDKNCSQFQNGNFIYRIHFPQGDNIFHITRNDSIQTEVEEGTGKFSKLSIKWTGNCNFELKLLETSFDFPDSIQNIRKTIPLKGEILSWTNEYYIFKARRENTNFSLTDTIWFTK
jgi:hypothetical protein